MGSGPISPGSFHWLTLGSIGKEHLHLIGGRPVFDRARHVGPLIA